MDSYSGLGVIDEAQDKMGIDVKEENMIAYMFYSYYSLYNLIYYSEIHSIYSWTNVDFVLTNSFLIHLAPA